MKQFDSFILEKLKIDKDIKNIEQQNIINCSKVQYSIIVVENDKIYSKIFDNFSDFHKFIENLHGDNFDNTEEIIDDRLTMNSSLLLKQDEKNYQIISCFDKERK